jgi:hypothetical protein
MAPDSPFVYVEDDPHHLRGNECIVGQLVKSLKNFEDMGHDELRRTAKAVVRR